MSGFSRCGALFIRAVFALLLLGSCFDAFSASSSITSVTAQQRYPWNGLVDIAVTFNGEQSEVAKANCVFAATNSATKAALTIAHVTPQGDATGSGTTWTRRFIWDTNVDLGEVKIDDVELVANVEAVAEEPEDLGGVQLWEDGPYWAECNVGASKPEEYGLYFWWGDTVGYKRNANDDGWISAKDSTTYTFTDDNCPTYRKTIAELQSLGYIDLSENLVPAHDAARVHKGAQWRMPTALEIEGLSLSRYCTTEWTTRNGVNGRLITGKGAYASKSIFLPASGSGYHSRIFDVGSFGDYWSSTPPSSGPKYAWAFVFSSSYLGWWESNNRFYGQSVRPVRAFDK